MGEQRVKYPRTPILPWSPGKDPDDVRAMSIASLEGREVVVTEKLDGENTTIYRDGLHARSLDSGHHPSRAWVKALWGRVGYLLPKGLRLCGENMAARHSIVYRDLASFFYLFSVWEGARCLSWDETCAWAERLSLVTPPQLYRGPFSKKRLQAIAVDPAHQEGYVVRLASSFSLHDFRSSIAKWVRRGHVQTSGHWMYQEMVPNQLARSPARARK